jgi:cyclase
MLKKRLIPVLLLMNGMLVRSEKFHTHQVLGNPIHEVERFNEWNVDELIYIDISRVNEYDLRRSDSKVSPLTNPMDILDQVSRTCFMPLTWGGRIRSIEDMRERFLRGADKIVINTSAFENPTLIQDGAQIFGRQAIVVSIDAKKHLNGEYEVYTNCGRTPTGKLVAEWAAQVEGAGAGEIFLQSIDEDGMGEGYDTDVIQLVCSKVNIPVIACGGVGRFEDYAAGIEAGASAVAAANLWHFKELADRAGKRALAKAGIQVRD